MPEHAGCDPEYPYTTPPQAQQSDQERYFASTRTQPDGPPWVHATRPRADADGAAIAALITAFFFAPLGIIFGHVSRGQAKRRGRQPSVTATAGCVPGSIFTPLLI